MKTVFLRVLEADDKAAALLAAIRDPEHARGKQWFEVDTASFASIPRSPFSYWVSERLRGMFIALPALGAEGRVAASGGKTLNDFRWIRADWEVSPREETGWVGFAKGGAYSPYYANVYLLLDWRDDARSLKDYLVSYRSSHGWSPNWTAELHSSDHYFRPGLTWPLRTNGLSLRAMPAGCIFSHKGPAAFVANDDYDELLSLAAVTNSQAFKMLVSLQLARTELAQSYEVGLIQQTPVPNLSPSERSSLASLALRAWSLKRSLDTCTETSHAFVLPALLQVQGAHLAGRAAAWSSHVLAVQAELAEIQSEIDERCFALYGIDEADRRAITEGFGPSTETDANGDADAEDDSEVGDEADTSLVHDLPVLAADFVSWAVGAAFGRFDLRLATGDRAMPVEPEPFDPLPACSSGMLTGEDGLPLSRPPPNYPIPFPESGVLVDDPGHAQHLTAAVHAVFEVVFGADADRWWNDMSAAVDPKSCDLGAWLGGSFFEHHLKRLSKSRRKAPILWQLATPSGGYSVWLYAHRVTDDTFYQLQGEIVGTKLVHEERRLTSLVQSAGGSPAPGQRREITDQEARVQELRGFLEEIKRIAPLWRSDLDDGVVLTMAPLHRLVPQHRSWQKELATRWGELAAGKHDWAHLAMHLWPERVVPKCADDRSLAIAHGLEDKFWVEGSDGKWQKREADRAAVDALAAKRTSPAVKDALKSLLDAPAPSTGRGGGKRSASPRRAAATGKKSRQVAPASVDGSGDAAIERVREAIASAGAADGASKADVVAATGISDGQWNAAINALLAQGLVTKTGARRGARYHIVETGGRS